MIEWLSDTIHLLLSGTHQLLTAAFRLGLVFLALVIAWNYVIALTKRPIAMIRGTVAVIVMLFIGFGAILVVPKYLDLNVIFIWIVGWMVAYYMAKYIGGWHDEEMHDASSSENNRTEE